ncbi:MAG TPA: hypothetical protein VN577_04175 [Terriglobales bacterium]|nr:hypothetical protein [Terriglobales bacterium]
MKVIFNMAPGIVKSLPVLILAMALVAGTASAQTASPPPSSDTQKVSAIEDNSFLIEEAFNQERNVIQHISTFTRDWDSNTWAYSFTQEWPFPGSPKHQLSYTLVASHSADHPGSGGGLGDVALNYRYQLVGGGGQRFSFSPRFSLLLPTGNAIYGRGSGGIGYQGNLPFSIYLNRKFITHINAGTTIIPHAKNELGDRATITGWNLGQSLIWLARPNFNVMMETAWYGYESVVGKSQTQRGHDLLLSPGIRWAHNLKSGLQIVPGVAVPIGVGPSSGQKGVILYLSFEHAIGPTD